MFQDEVWTYRLVGTFVYKWSWQNSQNYNEELSENYFSPFSVTTLLHNYTLPLLYQFSLTPLS